MNLFDKKAKPFKDFSVSSFEGPPMKEAIESAKVIHSNLLDNYNEQIRSGVAAIISDGIKNKRGLNGISLDIRKQYPQIGKPHADLLAQAETGYALSLGSERRSRSMGVDGKKWVLGAGGEEGSCEYCKANAAAGVIPIDQPFPSGVMSYPAHDGCRCAVAPAMLKK